MRIKIGYYRLLYENQGIKFPVTIRSEGSILLSGPTGTGKTTLLWFMLHNYIQLMDGQLSMIVCDWKREYKPLFGCKRYCFNVQDIINAIDDFYTDFESARQNNKREGNIQHILVIDEYFSFTSYVEAMSKINKEYKEIYSRIAMEISSILAMGRTMGYSLICVVQQAQTKGNFASSADRGNFINKISMGSISDIAVREIFEATDTEGINFRKPMPPGTGFAAVQGERMVEIIVPKIMNPEKMYQTVRTFLDELD